MKGVRSGTQYRQEPLIPGGANHSFDRLRRKKLVPRFDPGQEIPNKAFSTGSLGRSPCHQSGKEIRNIEKEFYGSLRYYSRLRAANCLQ